MAELRALLGDGGKRERLVNDMIRGEEGIEEALDRARDRLTLFREGLGEIPHGGQAGKRPSPLAWSRGAGIKPNQRLI